MRRMALIMVLAVLPLGMGGCFSGRNTASTTRYFPDLPRAGAYRDVASHLDSAGTAEVLVVPIGVRGGASRDEIYVDVLVESRVPRDALIVAEGLERTLAASRDDDLLALWVDGTALKVKSWVNAWRQARSDIGTFAVLERDAVRRVASPREDGDAARERWTVTFTFETTPRIDRHGDGAVWCRLNGDAFRGSMTGLDRLPTIHIVEERVETPIRVEH